MNNNKSYNFTPFSPSTKNQRRKIERGEGALLQGGALLVT